MLLADWPLTPALDMWALAVTAWQMFTGGGVPFRPFQGGEGKIGAGNFSKTLLEAMVKVLGPVPPHVVKRADKA